MSEDTSKKPFEFQMIKLKMEIDQSLKSDYVVDTTEKAIYAANDILQDSPNEQMIVIALDIDNRPMASSIVATGDGNSIDQTCIRNIFQFAFVSNANSIVLVHNHPLSKQLIPSPKDIAFANQVANIGTQLKINVKDFVVVGNKWHKRSYYSLAKKSCVEDYNVRLNLKAKGQKGGEPVIDEINENGEVVRSLKTSEANKIAFQMDKEKQEKKFSFFR